MLYKLPQKSDEKGGSSTATQSDYPMPFFESLSSLALQKPVAMTIGNFDGVHRGHCQLLQRLTQYAQEIDAYSLVLTFAKHPASFFQPMKPLPLLTSKEHKELLLKKLGVDFVLPLSFTPQLANLTPEQFLTSIVQQIPLKALILGYDTTIGKNRQGNAAFLKQLAPTLNLSIEFVPCLQSQGSPISSTLLRNYIQQGNLQLASQLLGRPYTLLAPIIPGEKRGRQLGFPTLNLDISSLCIPPYGVYAVEIIGPEHKKRAIANLGTAPTFQVKTAPVLEVHSLENFALSELLTLSSFLEVHFCQFLRPEMRFSTATELQSQIKRDIAQAHAYFAPFS